MQLRSEYCDLCGSAPVVANYFFPTPPPEHLQPVLGKEPGTTWVCEDCNAMIAQELRKE